MVATKSARHNEGHSKKDIIRVISGKFSMIPRYSTTIQREVSTSSIKSAEIQHVHPKQKNVIHIIKAFYSYYL